MLVPLLQHGRACLSSIEGEVPLPCPWNLGPHFPLSTLSDSFAYPSPSPSPSLFIQVSILHMCLLVRLYSILHHT
jgi:hypothetical protein